jgi:hypothetical protein
MSRIKANEFARSCQGHMNLDRVTEYILVRNVGIEVDSVDRRVDGEAKNEWKDPLSH